MDFTLFLILNFLMISIYYMQWNWCYLKDFPPPSHLSLMSLTAYILGLVPSARTNGNYSPIMFSMLSASDTMRYIATTGKYIYLQHYYITSFQVFMVIFDHWLSTFNSLHYSMVKKPIKKKFITANYKSLHSPILHLLKISQKKFSSNDVYIYRNPFL